MFDAEVRAGFVGRIQKLQPNAQRQWGRMNAKQMVCHLTDQLRITLGDIPAKPMPSPLGFPVVKQLVIDVLPWPKGKIIGPAEAFTTPIGEWQQDLSTLVDLLEHFGKGSARNQWHTAWHPCPQVADSYAETERASRPELWA